MNSINVGILKCKVLFFYLHVHNFNFVNCLFIYKDNIFCAIKHISIPRCLLLIYEEVRSACITCSNDETHINASPSFHKITQV